MHDVKHGGNWCREWQEREQLAHEVHLGFLGGRRRRGMADEEAPIDKEVGPQN